MSKSGPHDECERRITELEALVNGQAAHIDRLVKELDKCERAAARMTLAIGKLKKGHT